MMYRGGDEVNGHRGVVLVRTIPLSFLVFRHPIQSKGSVFYQATLLEFKKSSRILHRKSMKTALSFDDRRASFGLRSPVPQVKIQRQLSRTG
jgi:hypothetical protein